MTKLKSFGCSFIYGTDLEDSEIEDSEIEGAASKKTWPALISKKLNLSYQCYAGPGQGNFKIYTDILANSYTNDTAIYIINWTWIDRFDYVDQQEHWNTLRPADENQEQTFYYRHLHSQLSDMISSASYIVSAAEHLDSLNCQYIMTYMDHNLLTPINPNWHDPRYLEVLQQKLSKLLVNFEGLNFLDWSKKYQYPISKSWHPLEAAHQAAADYWLASVTKLL